MLKIITSLLLVTGLVGCASPTPPPVFLLEGARDVRVAKSDPPDSYKEVGQVSAADGQGCGRFGYQGTYERAMVLLKNRAYQMGADYIQLFTMSEPRLVSDCFVNQYKLSGTAYKKN